MNWQGGKSASIPKGTTLLLAGETARAVYYVKQGCLKSYVMDAAGKEHILQFAPEDWLITDLDSFYNEKPALLSIEAIEPSEIITYDKTVFPLDEQMAPPMLQDALQKLRNNLIATHHRLITLLSSTAEERYLDFQERYPSLHGRLSQKLIAAYIGVTPEYLSDIRRKLAGKST